MCITFVDDEDECSASATCHDTVKLEHAVTEIDRCVHSSNTLKVYCILS